MTDFKLIQDYPDKQTIPEIQAQVQDAWPQDFKQGKHGDYTSQFVLLSSGGLTMGATLMNQRPLQKGDYVHFKCKEGKRGLSGISMNRYFSEKNQREQTNIKITTTAIDLASPEGLPGQNVQQPPQNNRALNQQKSPQHNQTIHPITLEDVAKIGKYFLEQFRESPDATELVKTFGATSIIQSKRPIDLTIPSEITTAQGAVKAAKEIMQPDAEDMGAPRKEDTPQFSQDDIPF